MTRPTPRLAQRFARRRAALPAAAIAVVLTFGLSACGASSEDTAAAMHTSVVQISERALAGDYAGAIAELALLDRDVAAALDAGRIDAAREAEIRAAMELVRADLEAAEVATTPTPTPTPTPTDDGDDDDSDRGNSGDNRNDDKGKDDGKGGGGD